MTRRQIPVTYRRGSLSLLLAEFCCCCPNYWLTDCGNVGPLLFIINVNDLPSVAFHSKISSPNYTYRVLVFAFWFHFRYIMKHLSRQRLLYDVFKHENDETSIVRLHREYFSSYFPYKARLCL